MVELVVALVFVVVVGLPSAWAVVPSWSVALPLTGVTSGLVLSAAAVGSLITRSALLPWVLVVTVATWLASAAVVARRPATPAGAAPAPGPVRAWCLAVVAPVSAPVLAGSLGPATEYDERAIWLFHARWLWSGGAAARDAMATAALGWSHSDYPPLVPATVAGLWSVVDGGDLQLGQAVTSVQGWLVVVLAGVLVTGAVRRRAQLPTAVLAAMFAIGSFGIAGGFGTRGYADLAWAAMATAAAIAGLVLPPTPVTMRLVAVCLAGAALTKSEGLVTVVAVLVPLIALRWLVVRRRAALPGLAALAAAVVVGASWLVLSARFGTEADRDITGAGVKALLQGEATQLDRVAPALRGLWGYARTTIVISTVVVVGGLVLARGPRREQHLGGGLWLPIAAAGSFLVALAALAAGELDLDFWLGSAGIRLVIIARALLLAEVLVVAAVAVDVLVGAPRGVAGGADGSDGAGNAADGADGEPEAVIDEAEKPAARRPAPVLGRTD